MQFTAVVNYNDKSYLIDACDTYDDKYEIIIFALRNKHDNKIEKKYDARTNLVNEVEKDVVFGSCLYCVSINSVSDAERLFDYLVNDFGSFFESNINKSNNSAGVRKVGTQELDVCYAHCKNIKKQITEVLEKVEKLEESIVSLYKRPQV